jgi:hypothetical protein
MIYYNLNKNLEGNKILSDIQKLISQCEQNELSNKVLVVRIETISDYTIDSPILKLEYQN